MTDSLPPGLYEVLVTEVLAERLVGIEERLVAHTDGVRSAEVADRVALHLSRVERAIDGVGDEHRVDVSVAVARDLVARLDKLATVRALTIGDPIVAVGRPVRMPAVISGSSDSPGSLLPLSSSPRSVRPARAATMAPPCAGAPVQEGHESHLETVRASQATSIRDAMARSLPIETRPVPTGASERIAVADLSAEIRVGGM